MQGKVIHVLFSAALVYGLIFLVPREIFADPLDAQWASVLLLILFLAALLWVLRRAGLWAYGGLAWTPEIARRVARNAALCAPILVIPLLNLVFDGSLPARSAAVLIAVLCGAAIEEVLLRGLTLPLLISFAPKHVLGAVLTCAILFAVLHLPNALTLEPPYVLAQVAVAFFLGVALGFMRVCTGSVYPGMVAHILINATANGPILYSSQNLWPWCLAAAAVSLWSFIWWKRLRPSN